MHSFLITQCFHLSCSINLDAKRTVLEHRWLCLDESNLGVGSGTLHLRQLGLVYLEVGTVGRQKGLFKGKDDLKFANMVYDFQLRPMARRNTLL